MKTIKLNEQISFLRKEKGVTQEELAVALGVTNQAVSKWESGQCCPDISLLPELSSYFNVSVDKLIGYRGADTSKDLALQIRSSLEALPAGEDYRQTLRLAYVLHAVIFSKYMSAPDAGNPGWNPDDAVCNAEEGVWGLSGICVPEITTYMRKESVFFSGNRNLRLNSANIRAISRLLKIFSESNHLRTMTAVYELTVDSGTLHAGISEISQKSGLSEEKVRDSIENGISEFLREETQNGELRYRIEGEHMYLVPLLAMLCTTS